MHCNCGVIFILIGVWMKIKSVSTCNGRVMIRSGGLSEYEKQTIVDMHNKMRQSVALGRIGSQPPAANMAELKWDDRLAGAAQKWTTNCSPYIHDESRHNSQYAVGQNIAKVWTTKYPETKDEYEPDFANDAINKWFNEFRAFTYGRHGEHATGHYSQMIWAETSAIGCGFAFYYDPARGFTKNYVCNYGPSGNVNGEVPYQKGYPSCYNYGLSDSRKYQGLCDKSYYYGYQSYSSHNVQKTSYQSYYHY